jgi:hypothetical protein
MVVGNVDDSKAELYDPIQKVWSITGPPMRRYFHSATRLADGWVVIVGGYGLSAASTVLLYDPNRNPPGLPQPVNPVVPIAIVAAALVLLGAATLSNRGSTEEWIP